jgi:hypothetical protein
MSITPRPSAAHGITRATPETGRLCAEPGSGRLPPTRPAKRIGGLRNWTYPGHETADARLDLRISPVCGPVLSALGLDDLIEHLWRRVQDHPAFEGLIVQVNAADVAVAGDEYIDFGPRVGDAVMHRV